MKPINVAIEDYIGPYPAMTDGTTWNGWECPRFTFSVACDVALDIILAGSIAGYDADADAFFTLDHSTGVQVDSWQAAMDASTLATFESPDPDPAADAQMEIAPGIYLDLWKKQDRGFYAIGAWSWVWDDITPVLARAFADMLRDDLEPDEWDEMRRRNATPAYAGGVCASHDFVDANMTMDRAFFAVFGRHPYQMPGNFEPGEELYDANATEARHENDNILWGAAWTLAKREDLTEPALT